MNARPGQRSTGRVTRADIEAKLAEIQTELEHETEQAKGTALTVGAVVVGVVVVAAFLWGRRKGRKKSVLVEVTRV